MHIYGVDWEFHHDLRMINRTAFLLDYLSDRVPGTKMYQGWINGDIYEDADEQFGICAFPGAHYTSYRTLMLCSCDHINRLAPYALWDGLVER